MRVMIIIVLQEEGKCPPSENWFGSGDVDILECWHSRSGMEWPFPGAACTPAKVLYKAGGPELPRWLRAACHLAG